jgi:shikimate kinase
MGLMGSGKSTVGLVLARRLGRTYLDNDTELQRRTGHSARELATEEGPEALHEDERAAFVDALSRTEPAVLGAPASVITDLGIRTQLRDHFAVWLDTDVDTLASRFEHEAHRPAFGVDPRTLLRRQREERAPLYREAAALVVRPDPATGPDDIVDQIVAALRPAETGDEQRRQ